jgi:drug/metabolite transporter (DMT)-like permease
MKNRAGSKVLAPASPAKADNMALCALVGAMLLWSGTFIAMRVALTAFHPMLMIFSRMLVSMVFLLPLVGGWVKRTRYSKGDWRIVLLLVVAEPCLYFMFEAYALRYTTASQAGVITALLPLLVGVSAFFILKERLALQAWVGFFLAFAGVIILTLAGEDTADAPNALLGNTLEFFAMLMACVYTLCVRKLAGFPPFFITALQAFAGTVFFAVMALVLDARLPDTLPALEPLIALAFLSFSTVMAYGLYNFGIARLGAGPAAAWINLIPGLTLIMGIIFLGESLSFVQTLAIVPILIGVVLSQRKS